MKTDIDVPSQLSDDDLLARVESLARRARRVQPHRGGTSGEGLPGHPPVARRGLAERGHGAAARLPSDSRESAPAARPRPESSGAATATDTASLPLAPTTPAPPRRPLVVPLAPDRYQIRFTASAETRENLRLAQDLLRHAIPSGDPAQIIDRALKVLVEQLRRKKFAATDRPRASRGTAPGSRDVAARVRRAVGLRDDGRCTFVGRSGRRCNERAFIEFHHDEPYGVGGEATAGNIQLLCRRTTHSRASGSTGAGVP